MNTGLMILLKRISILCHILIEIMCCSNLVVISPSQPDTSAPRSTHRQCLVQSRYTRVQLFNMANQLKSSKYCILPHSVINTFRQLKINKHPSKLRAQHIKYTSKVKTKNLVHIQLGTDRNISSNVRVGTVNARSGNNKLDIIVETSKIENLDFLVISETWLEEEDTHWLATSLDTRDYRIQTINRQGKQGEESHFYTRIDTKLLETTMHLN